jgi:opacity protein-like surface antigen
MRRFSIRFALAAALALIPALTSAQMHDDLSNNRFLSFGLGGGVTVPVSDAKDAFKNGFNGQGFVRLNLRFLPVSPRLDFTFSKFDLDDAKVGTTGTGQMLAGLANLQMYLIHGGPIRPYIVAGVGAYNVKTETDAAGAVTSQEVSDTRFGVNGGAGLVIKLGSLLSLYAEGRVDNVFTQDKGLIETDQIQMVPVSFGLVY